MAGYLLSMFFTSEEKKPAAPVRRGEEEVQWARRPLVSGGPTLKRIAVVGGTHGNERNGVHLVKHFIANPAILKRETCEVFPLLANEAAINANGTGAGRRYVDEDMNRCFSNAKLYKAPAGTPQSAEMKRAHEIDALLGPKNSLQPRTDFIFDLHNTTSNTGMLLCFHREDAFTADLGAHLQSLDPKVKLVIWPSTDLGLLPTVGRAGMTVEVGPVAHGTVHWDKMQRTMTLLKHALDYVEAWNTCCITWWKQQQELFEKQQAEAHAKAAEAAAAAPVAPASEGSTPKEAPKEAAKEEPKQEQPPNAAPPAGAGTQEGVRSGMWQRPPPAKYFETFGAIDYPRAANGEIDAFIHESLQGLPELEETSVLKEGQPLFRKMDGSVIAFSRAKFAPQFALSDSVYPLFINEAAYYEQGKAMVLCKPIPRQDVPPAAPQSGGK